MLRTAFWLFVIFLALSFFGISIERIIESPAGQQNIAYLTSLALSAWHWLVAHWEQIVAKVEAVRL